MKKFLLIPVLCVAFFASAAFALDVEDALTPAPEQSIYAVLRLDDTQALLKWIFSQEHIDIFMPLILASEDSNEILGAVEMLSAFAQNTPLRSAVFLAGVRGEEPFFRMAFKVDDDAEIFVRKIAQGNATPLDIAKLFFGKNNPLAVFAETMTKIEKVGNNILRVDNELFIKAQDDIVIAGLSIGDVEDSLNALEDSKTRFFEKKTRRFAPKDFAWFHVDPKSLEVLDDNDAVNVDKLKKYFGKPLDVELAFARVPGRFFLSTALNLSEAVAKRYFERFGLNRDYKNVPGGYIDLKGANEPLAAFGGLLNVESFKASDIWPRLTKQARNRFGISEGDLTKLFSGALSLVLNDNVTVEGFKIPAVYISQTGTDGVAEKIFETLEKSPHFQKIQDGVLQIDSTVSPVPCVVTKNNETLGVNFAENSNISATPVTKSALKRLIKTPASSAVWIDFEAIQSWLLAPENGILTILEPLARFSGQGAAFDALKEILTSKFSVPSVSIHSDSIEIVHAEFEINENVDAEEGLLSKLVKSGKNFLGSGKKKSK